MIFFYAGDRVCRKYLSQKTDYDYQQNACIYIIMCQSCMNKFKTYRMDKLKDLIA